jgi:hypothetical protein
MPTTPTCSATVTGRIHGWREASARDHFVQFYCTDEYLIECLAGYIAEGFWAGESTIVIATAEHRAALASRLRVKGVNVDASERRGRFVALDAEAAAARIVVDGRVRPEELSALITPLLESSPESKRPVRIFGEVVALLWARGQQTAALELEECWNELQRRHLFQLYCAYPATVGRGPGCDDICRSHTQVVSLGD